MAFRIVSTLSPDAVYAAGVFMPSWYKNAGADSITVHRIDQGNWYRNIGERNRIIRAAVLEAAKWRGKLLALDADCFVLDDLSAGFSPKHPISVARWPHPNMGVIFFNTAIAFDWRAFFDPLLDAILRRCNGPISKRTSGSMPYGDQYCWHEALKRIESRVCKLDPLVWNFAEQPQDWIDGLAKHGKGMKIAHVKGRFDIERQRPLIEAVREQFPQRV